MLMQSRGTLWCSLQRRLFESDAPKICSLLQVFNEKTAAAVGNGNSEKKPLTGKKFGRVFWLDFEKAGFLGARKNVGWWDSETAEAASMMNPIPWLVVLQRAAHCPVQRSEGWRAVEFFFDAAAFTDFEAGMFHAKYIWIDVNMLYLGYMAIYYPELWEQLCFEVPGFECPMPGRLWLWIRPSESVLANLQRVCEVQVPGHRCQWNGFGCRHIIWTRWDELSSSTQLSKQKDPATFSKHIRFFCLHQATYAGVATVCADDGKPFTLSGCEPIPCETPADMLDKYALSLGPKSSCQPSSHHTWLGGSLFFGVSEWYGEDFVCEPSSLRTGDVHTNFSTSAKDTLKTPRKTPTSLKDFSRPDQPLLHHHTLWFSCWNEVWAVLESQGIQCQCRMCWRSLGVGNLSYQAGQWWRSPMT